MNILAHASLCPHEYVSYGGLSWWPAESKAIIFLIVTLPNPFQTELSRTSLVVQWLRLCAPNAGDVGLICGGFSLPVSKGGYFLVAVHGLLIAVASLLWSTGLTVVARGLCCPVSYDIFPNQGSNLCLLHWRSDSSPLSHREALFCYLNITQNNVFKFPC